jgi:(p)ppGpp synthase/HD superfamily hydrolase
MKHHDAILFRGQILMEEKVKGAEQFATQAHRAINHRRKYTKRPYEVHLRAVAELVASVAPEDSEMIAAAWLHDTVEDTGVTLQDIETEFGHEISNLVADLTDVSRPRDGNRAVRKAIDREHIAQAASRAKTIKLADLIDNCRDICRYDPGFARVYIKEAAALMEVLKEGHQRLYEQALNVLNACAERLGDHQG